MSLNAKILLQILLQICDPDCTFAIYKITFNQHIRLTLLGVVIDSQKCTCVQKEYPV